ncbi:hypothetical protein CYLTODRAFT_411806 [Cylindrobasidium torrendii FP15055 ss-10]|uniref:FAD/NAD(P)-binding domain-containing protein n=1 Tax=Cylindrobasidium torrendii FP15055 ss-10 TaxID=1314674 RepID=A0A0D7B7K3_9AGAR|nr:hypothetical protein CYLTODRAFT_411806 [Cylindrobasidium torrendii FP15055 ss-10]
MSYTVAAVCAVVASVLYLAFPVLWEAARKRNMAKYTAYYDLKTLGHSRETSSKIPGTAVVCGGSIAGLLTARACHDHFERVVIIEPEAWLSTDEGRQTEALNQTSKRARIIQYDVYHGFHSLIYRAMANFFPDFDNAAAASGIKVDRTDMDYRISGVSPPSAPKFYGGNTPKRLWSSRRGLETLLRRLVLDTKAYPNIEQFVGSVLNNATGAAQAGHKWLPALGFAQDLQIQSYNPRAVYGSMTMRVPSSFWDSLSHMPDNARGPAAGPVPLPQWLFDFLDKLHEVEDTLAFQKIRQNADPSSLLPYEKCARLPENFVALGDANCRVNPIYGQGFAKVVNGVSSLNTLLEQGRFERALPRDFGRKFFNMQAPKIEPLWTNPKLFDTVPVPGESDNQMYKFKRRYIANLRKLAFKDEQAKLAMYRTSMMLDSATIDYFHPALIIKVFWQWMTSTA